MNVEETERGDVSAPASATRERRTIDGEWRFRTDPDDVGADHGWADRETDWPAEQCHTVEVPHAWQEIDATASYTGVAWYRTTFELDERDPATDTLVRFGAVDYETTAWVNDRHVGDHRGGYLPFAFDATDAVEAGTNTLVVRVEDPDDIAEIPHGKQGEPWYTRVSGIWQPVTVETRPSTRVTDLKVTPDLDGDDAHVDVETNATETDALSATVRVRRDDEIVASADAGVDGDGANVSLHVPDADYWRPDDPVLYTAEVVLRRDGTVVDRHRDRFGMRSFDHDGERFYLNGDPFYIRGALDQGYYPKTLYRPFKDGLFEREIRTAKDLGFNMLRKHIKPAHPDFLDAADEMGILVWEEAANPAVDTPRSRREMREQIHRLVDRDYNRPSVVAWSLYNEEWGLGHAPDEAFVWDDPEKQDYLAELYEEVKAIDPTRPICDNSGWAHVATDINDYHRYYVSPDRADEWAADLDRMVDRPHENYAAERTDPADAPVVLSEFGTWGLCDTSNLTEFYDGQDPPWFHHSFLTPDDHDRALSDPEKHLESGTRRSPAGWKDRLAQTTLLDVFDDVEALEETWQWRQFLSIKDVVEQTRTRAGVAGYVITEWTDIEWEFNGILDYCREPKAFYDDFARLNAPVAVSVDPDAYVHWAGDGLRADVDVVNDRPRSGTGTLSWELRRDDDAGTVVDGGETTVDVGPARLTTVTDAVATEFPVTDDVARYSLRVRVDTDLADDEVWTTETLTVVPSAVDDHDRTVYATDESLADRLRGARYRVAEELTDDVDVVVATAHSDRVSDFVEAGGAAVVVPPAHGLAPQTPVLSYRELPAGENWNLVSALYAHDDDLLTDLVGSQRLDRAFESIYPNAVATGLDEDDTVAVGYVEGWLSNWGSPLVTRPVGDGVVCSCTFPVATAYGDHPTATVLLDRLVDRVAGDDPA